MSGNTYANPTLQEMHDFMSAVGMVRDKPSTHTKTKEITYSRLLGRNSQGQETSIVVFTSIRHNGITRRRGSDAIRVTLFSQPVGFVKGTKRVNRTRNWRLNLLKRIETLEDSL